MFQHNAGRQALTAALAGLGAALTVGLAVLAWAGLGAAVAAAYRALAEGELWAVALIAAVFVAAAIIADATRGGGD